MVSLSSFENSIFGAPGSYLPSPMNSFYVIFRLLSFHFFRFGSIYSIFFGFELFSFSTVRIFSSLYMGKTDLCLLPNFFSRTKCRAELILSKINPLYPVA